MIISGWGRLPLMEARVAQPASTRACEVLLASARAQRRTVLARGLGRSYGDSALNEDVIDVTRLDHFLAFDSGRGVLAAEAGVSFGDILKLSVPRGWFLPVTPGTQFVTLGGAIASDVHGKNHHRAGSLSQHVIDLELLTGNGERVVCSPAENAELFRATCGGMGLTGVILTARLRLLRIGSSDILCRTLRFDALEGIVEALTASNATAYSVAWVDCLATGRSLGRSLLMLGEHAGEGPLDYRPPTPRPVPRGFPSALLNPFTIRAFNALYYHRPLAARARVPYGPWFYPLDELQDWNRLYGPLGFMQYQFVLPLAAGIRPLREILGRIAGSGLGSFLAVLKGFGPGNDNPLSFPLEGFSLALDFKYHAKLPALLDGLDEIVGHHGGRVYLTKDARLCAANFRRGYPAWQAFEEVRARHGAHGRFASAQSRRLGLA